MLVVVVARGGGGRSQGRSRQCGWLALEDVMASPRSTFKGSAADLAAIVVCHALVDGKSFLRYCERQPCKVATMDVGKFEKHALLASDLHKLQPNMSFKKAITAKALQLAGKELNKEFGFTPAQLQDWTTTMAARLRNFAFHISSGMRKHPQCRWVLALPWNQKGGHQRRCASLRRSRARRLL